MDWTFLDRQSQNLDLPNVGHAKPDAFYSQLPPPSKTCDFSMNPPQEFGRGLVPFGFESQSTMSRASCEPAERNQPVHETLRTQSTQEQQQQQRQQQHELGSTHSQSHHTESIGSTAPSGQLALSYSHSPASTNSSFINAGQCISLCTQIISHLESQISDSSLAVDGVLRISKSCISGLLHITSLDSCKANPNCFLLLCVAVNQMTTLFENNIPAMSSLLNSLSVSTLPSLLFGSFQVDHEDQLAFCARLLYREIQRCRQLLDRISDIHDHHQQQSQEPNNVADSTASLLQKQWFLVSAGRLDGLVAAVAA